MMPRWSERLSVLLTACLTLAACSGSGAASTGSDGLPWWGWLLIVLAIVLLALLIWGRLGRRRGRRPDAAAPRDMAVRVFVPQPVPTASMAIPEPAEAEDSHVEAGATAQAVEAASGPEDWYIEASAAARAAEGPPELPAAQESVEAEGGQAEQRAAAQTVEAPSGPRAALGAAEAEDSHVEADAPPETVEAAPFEAPAAPEPVQTVMVFEPDDLTVLEGVGPKVSALLEGAGITTYISLAIADVDRLRGILVRANLPMISPATWSEQAMLAAAGKWEELATLQDELKGGRRA